MSNFGPPPRMEDNYEGRVQTILPVPPRPKRPTLQPVQSTPQLSSRPLRHASSFDYLCEKSRYHRAKSTESSILRLSPNADGVQFPLMVTAATTPPSTPRSLPGLLPVSTRHSSLRASSGSTAFPTEAAAIPPVPTIPQWLVTPNDKRSKLRKSDSNVPSFMSSNAASTGPAWRARRGTLGTPYSVLPMVAAAC